MYKKLTNFSFILALFTGSAFGAYAADFNFLPSTGSGGLNQEFTVNLKIDSGDTSINAAQAKISFDPNILQVKDISKDGAIFNFWLQEPEYSNTDGTLEFIGGTPNGISGSSLQVLKIIFNGKSIGASNLEFSDAAITAADGSGTNILGNANGASFTVSSGGAVPTPPPAAPGAPPVIIATPIPAPVQITREAIKVSGLPVTPDISLPLYPDPDVWYNLVSSFTVSWDLPADISDLATELNQNPNYTVPNNSEGLFNSKTYPALAEDGVYYFHLRFKNNIGWGPTAHYRIALDTQPPLPFKIAVETGLSSDNPSPLLVFNSGDALSGIDFNIIQVNSEEPIVHSRAEYEFDPRPPGLYMISVKVVDRAGNSVEDRVQVDILPIKAPEVTYITREVIKGSEDLLTIKGIAVENGSVEITIKDRKDFLVSQNETASDNEGEWEYRFDQELRSGSYFVTLMSKDKRGASSLLTDPIKVVYKDKPIIVLGNWEITLKDLIILLVIMGVSGAGYYWRKVLLHITRAHRESIIIKRDIHNSFANAREHLKKYSSMADQQNMSKEAGTEELKRINESLEKVEKYVGKDIERLK